MGVVHGLEGDAGVIAVEIAVLYQIFDRIDNLQTKQRNMWLAGNYIQPSTLFC